LSDDEDAREIALNRETARELFTFEFIRDAYSLIFPIALRPFCTIL
jgi:hypothetical protein